MKVVKCTLLSTSENVSKQNKQTKKPNKQTKKNKKKKKEKKKKKTKKKTNKQTNKQKYSNIHTDNQINIDGYNFSIVYQDIISLHFNFKL